MNQKMPDWMAEADRKTFDMLLQMWREYMHSGTHELGFKGRDSILSSDGSLDSEQLYSRADRVIQLAVDACIDSLPPLERTAIYAISGQSRVFRYERFTFEEMVIRGERELLAKFKRHADLRVKF
jgi:hypothetical protein